VEPGRSGPGTALAAAALFGLSAPAAKLLAGAVDPWLLAGLLYHQHVHPPGTVPGEPHSHPHVHTPLRHSHPHFPDLHHRHPH
jgi:hypothetical protein